MKDNRESGFLAAEWSIALAVLLLPAFVVAFSIANLPSRKHLSQTASAAAARAYVEALDQGQAEQSARAAAAEVINAEYPGSVNTSELLSNGVDSSNGTKVEIVSSSTYCPGQEATVRVTMRLPLLIDFFNDNVRANIPVSSTATERIDDYAEVAGNDVDSGACDTP